MTDLIKADYYRILKSKLFLILTIICFVLPILTALTYLIMEKVIALSSDFTGIEGLNISGRLLISESFALSSNMGLILSIFITIFIATDVSNGTLRNKLIAGKSRTSIYFSHFITTATISATLILMNVLVFILFTCLLFGYGATLDGAEMVRIVFFLITGIITFVFSASISTAITLSIKSSAASVIITVLAGMGFSIIASLVHQADPLLDKTWLCIIPTYTNSSFLASGIFKWQSFVIGILSYLIFGTAITLAGLYFFKKKDVK